MNPAKRRAIYETLRALNPNPTTELLYTTPFELLVAVVLSAQATDKGVNAATRVLFKIANTPRALLKLGEEKLSGYIHSTGFYRAKARNVIKLSQALVDQHGGEVPRNREALEALPGVGRKTANLVLILAYESQKNICVDTHVHRIANRLGWVHTGTPDETEQALYRVTEARWWPYINLYLVTWGQNVCRPVYPRCPACAIKDLCPRIGVTVVSKTKPESYPLDP